MKRLRSLLFTPGNRPKMLEKAPSSGADALIFDLEDSVPVSQKAEARIITREYLGRFKKECAIYVRVNALETGMLRDDLEAVMVDGLEGIALPKVDSPDTIRAVDRMMAEVEQARGLPIGKIELSLSLETARGVYFAYDILTAARRVGSVAVGIAEDGDLQTDIGYQTSEDGSEMLYLRSKVLLAARAAGIENPIEGSYANFRDEAGLIKTAQMGRRLGYRGKRAIHPCQVDVINRIFTPTAREVAYYRRVLEAFEAALAQGRASTSVDGKMIDYPMAENARRVIAWAESLGVKD